MRSFGSCLLVAFLSTFLIPAHAYWGDESYDPNPSLFDLDKNAQFDAVGLLTAAVLAGNKLTVIKENFESGFTNRQKLREIVITDIPVIMFSYRMNGGDAHEDDYTGTQWRVRRNGGTNLAFG